MNYGDPVACGAVGNRGHMRLLIKKGRHMPPSKFELVCLGVDANTPPCIKSAPYSN